MKALQHIGLVPLAIVAGIMGGLLVGGIFIAASLYAIADSIFHISPEKPLSDE